MVIVLGFAFLILFVLVPFCMIMERAVAFISADSFTVAKQAQDKSMLY